MKHAARVLALLGTASAALACSGTPDENPARGAAAVSAPFTPINQGLYRISPMLAPHKSFDLPGFCPGLRNNAPVALYRFDAYNCNYPGTDQKWYIQQAGSDGNGPYYTVYQGAQGSSQCLDLMNWNAANGGVVETYQCLGNDAQHWYFKQIDGGSLYGTFEIASRINTNFVIDLHGNGLTENGTPITMWQDWGGDGQRWVLTRADQDMLVEDWSDDFTSLDTGTWNYKTYAAGTVNGELQNYTTSPSNVWSDGAKLHIDAHYNPGAAPNTRGAYTSGRIDTQNHADFQNGAWSTSARLFTNDNRHKGAWPGVWFVGQNNDQGAVWPNYGAREIDLWEFMSVNGANGPNGWADQGKPSYYGCDVNAIYGVQNNVIADMLTNHTGNPNAYWNPDDWGLFRVQFDEYVGTGGPQLRFFSNGYPLQAWGMDAFYNQPFFAIINLAIGGMGGGDASGFSFTSDWAGVQVDWIAHERWCTAAAMAAGGC